VIIVPIEIEVAQNLIKEAKERGKGRNFRQTVDVTFNLKEFDIKDQKNRINEDVLLPNGRGKDIKICVIAGGDMALRAKDLGAGVLMREDLDSISKDKKKVKAISAEYDYFIAQADMMPLVGRSLGSVLGPRGKMPKPVPPNANIDGLIERLSKTVTIRNQRDQPIINSSVGTEAMDDHELAENLRSLVEAVERTLPRADQNIGSIIVKTTMGSPVEAP
jgi:large subunit ribosomal protein L1